MTSSEQLAIVQPVVTVVVPVHDDPAGVRVCVARLREQDYPADRLQVLVCDNNSAVRLTAFPDGPAGGPTVELLYEPVPGSYRARNACLARSTGQVIAFTDADCTPERDWVSKGVAALDTTGSDLVAGRVTVHSHRARPNALEVHEMVSAFPQEKYVSRMNFGVTANLFVRRSVFDGVGLFVEDLTSGGDREFCTRAVAAGLRLSYAHEAVVGHPARATVPAVWEKARRVRRGTFEERRLPVSPGAWARRLVPPVGAVRRSRDPRVPEGARLRYVIGEVTAHYVALVAELPYVFRVQGDRSIARRS